MPAGRKPSQMEKTASAWYLKPPPGTPEKVEQAFMAAVLSMPAGYFTMAHQQALLTYARIKVDLDRVHEQTDAEGYRDVVIGVGGSWVVHPLTKLKQSLRAELAAYAKLCRLTPMSTTEAKSTPAGAPPSAPDDGEGDDNPATERARRLRSVV